MRNKSYGNVLMWAVSIMMLNTIAGAHEQKIISATITDWFNDNNAALSITFDDGTHDQVIFGLPLLTKYKLHGTFYLPTNSMKDRDLWKAAFKSGNEIGSHTVSHPHLLKLSYEAIKNEIQSSYDQLVSMIPEQQCMTIAYPLGEVNHDIINTAKNYFAAGRLARKSNSFINEYSSLDLYQLKAFGLSDGTTEQDLHNILIELHQKRGWLIEVIHGINNPKHTMKSGWRPIDYEILEKHVRSIASTQNRLWIAPVNAVAVYIFEKQNSRILLKQTNVTAFEMRISLNNALSHCLLPLSIKITLAPRVFIKKLIQENHALAYYCVKNTCTFNMLPGSSPVHIQLK